MTKLTVIRVINSYTRKDGWGVDCVEGSDGNIWHVKQKPNSCWSSGDTITKAEKFIEK